MKKAIIAGLAVVLLAACEDRDDPAGPPIDDSIGQVFEDEISFDYDSEDGVWVAGVGIPSDIEVFESDVILVYRLVGFLPDEDADVWEMLPNVYFRPEGIFQYVFDYTFFDVKLTIDGSFDLSDLHPDFTDDQVFRFVVAPAALVTESNVDITDYEAVVKALEIVGDHQLK